MSSINSQRKGCKDVFNAFLVKNATYEGELEIPCIKPIKEIPNKMISFSKAVSKYNDDYNQWIHFYEDDYAFERIWNNPRYYLEKIKMFRGVISPDFSLYRDMPLVMQQWNIYRNRAIGSWLQMNGVNVIPNVRFGDKRTYDICCEGIDSGSIIAIGSHSNLKNKYDRNVFLDGLDAVVNNISPETIIIYGAAPKKYFDKYIQQGIRIVQFDSSFATSHKGVL